MDGIALILKPMSVHFGSTMPILLAPKEAFLRLAGWHGTNEQRVLIVGETPKRWRIRAIVATRLAGHDRWLAEGEEILVPRSALRIPNGS
jgi:hypothetical protein